MCHCLLQGTTHLDSLHVAVPAVASGAIGISSGTKEHDEDYWRRLKQFKDLWGTVESIADKGKVRLRGHVVYRYLENIKLVICEPMCA